MDCLWKGNGPGNLDNDAIGVANQWDFNEDLMKRRTEIASLLERFKVDPVQTRHEVRVELGWIEELAAEIFALVVFTCDGLLEIEELNLSGGARFFRIAKKLPMKLQVIICHCVVGSPGESIRVPLRERGFRELAKLVLVQGFC